MLVQNIRGELTVLDDSEPNFSLNDSEFIRTIATALHVSTSKVRDVFRNLQCKCLSHVFPTRKFIFFVDTCFLL